MKLKTKSIKKSKTKQIVIKRMKTKIDIKINEIKYWGMKLKKNMKRI
jgi:hypothetical protein